MTDVWSNTCELTQPPRLQGETTSIGTRGPRPKARPYNPAGSSAVDALGPRRASWYSPSSSTVDRPPDSPSGWRAGGAGGGTWSKKQSFSS